MITAEALWVEMWPEVPWDEASEADRDLMRDHAQSLNYYYLTQREN